MAWQPQGTLDDVMLDQIADWLVAIEKLSFPFTRFIDFSQLTTVAVRPVTFLKLRAGERSNSPESGPSELRCFPTTGSPLASPLCMSR